MKPRILFTFLALLLCLTAWPQTGDSLLRVAEHARGAALVPAYQAAADAYYREGSQGQALVAAEQAATLAAAEGNIPAIITAKVLKGRILVERQLADSALVELHEALRLATSKRPPESRPEILVVSGRAIFTQGRAAGAFDTTHLALREAKALKQHKVVAEAIQNLGNFHYYSASPDSAKHWYKESISFSRQHNLRLVKPLMNLAIVYDMKGEADSALQLYLNALSATDTDNFQHRKERAKVIHNLGSFFEERGDMGMAMTYYTDALNLFSSLGDVRAISIVRLNIALLLQNKGQNREAIDLLQRTMLENEVQSDPYLLNHARLNMAKAYYGLSILDSAQAELEMLDEALDNTYDPATEAEMYQLLARIALRDLRPATALNMVEKSIHLANDAGYEVVVLTGMLLSVDAWIAMGITEKAVATAKATRERALQGRYMREAIESTYHLGNLLSTSNPAAALGYFRESIALRDSLFQEYTESEYTRLQLQMKDSEYRMLENEKVLQEARLNAQMAQVRTQRIQYYLVLAVAISLLVLLVVIVLIMKRIQSTNRKLANQNLYIEEQNLQLTLMDQDKDRLMHVVAHDLRNPMLGIKGLSELLQQDTSLPDDVRHQILMMHRASDHGLEIISGLLEYRKESGIEGQVGKISLDRIVEDVTARYKPAALVKKLRLHTTSQPVTIESDQIKVTRIIENLLSNAIKFSPQGSKVSLVLARQNGSALVQVSDEGPGFTDEDKLKVFQKYQTLSARPTSGEVSTGLGLSIVRDFVQMLGGELILESSPGKGSTFTVKLPA